MKSVSVARLKSNLSQYFKAVKKERKSLSHLIARLTPLEEDCPAIEIMTARKPISSLKKIKRIKLNADPVACCPTGGADECVP